MERDSKEVYERGKNFLKVKCINCHMMSVHKFLQLICKNGTYRYIVLNITSWKQSHSN